MAEKISVVIPNWNGKHWLKTCLDSLSAQRFTDFRTYVVDNGSTDGSAAFIRENYPEVILIENAENLGFAGGMNRGFSEARGELLIALNNDVETDPLWLETIAEVMDANPQAGSGASQLMDFEARDVVDSLGDGYFPFGLSFKAWSGSTYPVQGLPVREIQSPCAAASVYRREMLDRIGLFDEDFFAYMEDIDLGLRAQSAGYGCIFIPGAKVFHIGSATSGGTASAFSMKLTVRNTYQVILKNVPTILLPVYLALTLLLHLGVLFFSLFLSKSNWIAKNRRAVFQGISEALKEAPNSLRKRRKINLTRRQSTMEFIRITWRTFRFRAS